MKIASTDMSSEELNKIIKEIKNILAKAEIQIPDQENELISMLEQIKNLDKQKISKIIEVIRLMGGFNILIRNEIKDINTDEDYKIIVDEFKIIIDSLKKTVEKTNVSGDKINIASLKLPSTIVKGKTYIGRLIPDLLKRKKTESPSERFDTILQKYKDTSDKTKISLEKEEAIIKAYHKFRTALTASIQLIDKLDNGLKEKDMVLKRQLLEIEEGTTQHRELQFQIHELEDQILTIENLNDAFTTAIQIGDTTGLKMMSTYKTKRALYQRGVQFFTINESSFVMLGATVTQNLSLSNTVSASEAMKSGTEQTLNVLGESSKNLNQRALEATHGSLVDKDVILKLVNNTVRWEEEAVKLISDLRSERSEANKLVEEGMRKIHGLGSTLKIEHRK